MSGVWLTRAGLLDFPCFSIPIVCLYHMLKWNLTLPTKSFLINRTIRQLSQYLTGPQPRYLSDKVVDSKQKLENGL